MKIGMRANRPFIITAENQGQPILNAQTVLEALYMAPGKRQLGPVETFEPEDLAAPVTQPRQILPLE